jgi:hypothetical protein
MEKQIILLVVLISGIAASVSSQSIQGIPYQAVARNASGNIVANQSISLRFSLLQGSVSGTLVYRETHSATTNTLGLFNVNVLKGTPTGPFDPLKWNVLAASGVFMKVEMDITGGSTYTDMGTTQLLSVPFALYAEKSGETFGAVVFKGTWNASLGTPPAAGSPDIKGYYYVVSVAGNTALNGITDWQISDWAIYNGTGWEKVDNSQSPVAADNVAFTPASGITSTNVQDAVEEVSSDFADLIDSFLNLTDDGLTVYSTKHFGINDTTSSSPLGIKGETGQDDQMISFKSADQSQKWNINLNPTVSDVDGFSIDDITTGVSSSRFFIDHVSEGNIGIGTVQPNAKLHVTGANDGGNVSIMVENLESGVNGGWLMSAVEDNAIPERMKTFAIHEKTGSSLEERITVLSGGNVGINETLPYAKLHVSRSPADPQAELQLAENTGVVLLGPIDDKNLAMDAHQIQARTGEYIGGGTTLSFTATPLGLQPYGGGILINANSSVGSEKAIVTSDARLGLGTITPAEKIEINGAIKIGTTISANTGTIRWSGSDFEGYDGSNWKSFTLSNWAGTLTLSGAPAITYNPSSPKVGIGVVNPSAALDIHESSSVTGESTAMILTNSSSTSSSSSNRVGLKISMNGFWAFSSSSKNIGLYIPEVTGQSNSNANLAAVLNGNVVIGDVTSSPMIGASGKNVLGFQNGDIPTQAIGAPGVTNGGIQVYSASNSLGTSVFNVMTGDGHVIQLFRSPAIAAPDNSPVGSSYGTSEQAIISNMRDRINALESKLQALGLLD